MRCSSCNPCLTEHPQAYDGGPFALERTACFMYRMVTRLCFHLYDAQTQPPTTEPSIYAPSQPAVGEKHSVAGKPSNKQELLGITVIYIS